MKMDISRLKSLAGITKSDVKVPSEIIKEYKVSRMGDIVEFINHVKSYGVGIVFDHESSYATITINEDTKENSEQLYTKIIHEWNYGSESIVEESTIWALYIKAPDEEHYSLQFTDKDRSVVADEWVDSWKDQYDDDNKRIKYKHKIVKTDGKDVPNKLNESNIVEAFETLNDVTKAVDANRKVAWKTPFYVVNKNILGEYFVTYMARTSRSPLSKKLFRDDGKSSDFKPGDFFLDENVIEEAATILPSIDSDRYVEREGLEGPFRWRNGRVTYYDPKEGKYYDPDTDMYIEYDEYIRANNPDIRESANLNEEKFETIELQLPSHWASALMNGDTSGLEDEEEAALNRWIEWASNEYNIYAGQPLNVSDDVEFRRYHDANGFVAATDVLTYVYQVNDPVTESESSSTKDDKPNSDQKLPDEKRIKILKNNIENYKEKNRTLPKGNSLRQDQEKQIERWTKELKSLLSEDHGGGFYVCYDNNKEHYKTEAEATAAKIKLEKSGTKNVTVKPDTEDGDKEALEKANMELKEEKDIHTKLHDSDKNTKIKIPKEVKDEAKKQIADIKKSIDEFEEATKIQSTTDIKHNAIDCIEKLLNILEGGTLEDLKKAQIYYSTLMNPITVLLPNLLTKLLTEPKHFIKL